MRDTIKLKEKFVVWINIKKNHKIELNDDVLNEIDSIYYDYRKSNIMDLGLYRMVNIIFSLLSLVFWWIIKDTIYSEYAFLTIISLFGILNLFGLINQAQKNKFLKKR